MRSREHCIASQRGVHQGHPMGPALFSLAIHLAKADAEAATGRPLVLSFFFVDDGVAADDIATVSAW